jgi:hypothetical protein
VHSVILKLFFDYCADERKRGIIRVFETLQQIPPDGMRV